MVALFHMNVALSCCVCLFVYLLRELHELGALYELPWVELMMFALSGIFP